MSLIVEGVSIPDSKLAREITEVVRDTETPLLSSVARHSRTSRVDTIAATTLVAPREEVIERLRTLQRAGLTGVFLNPPLDGFEEYVDDFAHEIIEHM